MTLVTVPAPYPLADDCFEPTSLSATSGSFEPDKWATNYSQRAEGASITYPDRGGTIDIKRMVLISYLVIDIKGINYNVRHQTMGGDRGLGFGIEYMDVAFTVSQQCPHFHLCTATEPFNADESIQTSLPTGS